MKKRKEKLSQKKKKKKELNKVLEELESKKKI